MTSATVLFANVLRSMSESLELRCTSWIAYNSNVVDILDNIFIKGRGTENGMSHNRLNRPIVYLL